MTMSQLLLFITVLCVSVCGIAGYSVSGKNIVDSNGNKVTIRGVCRPSFEWNAEGEKASYADYALMKNSWGANNVRISLNQDFWLAGSSYAGVIDQQIAWITQLGMGVILDLHWNQGAQQNMADRNSITFWKSVAARYKNNLDIMFELYNEPRDISWSQWLNGDATYAGMQEMYAAVRNTGADNVVIVGGLNWAFDLSGVISGKYAVKGDNIAYATHPYDYPGKQLADWASAFGSLAATAPVIMTEFGQYCATNNYVADLLNYAEALGIHYTAWAWYVNGCAFPSVISDWNGTPFPGVGVTVKNYILKNKGSNSGNSGSTPAPPSSSATTRPTTAPTSRPPTAGTSAPVDVDDDVPAAAGSLSVYSSGLKSTWQDWSWSTSYSLSDKEFVRGSSSIRFEAWKYQGVYLHTTNSFAFGAYNSFNFYVNGGTSSKAGSSVSVKLYSSDNLVLGSSVNVPVNIAANQWNLVSIPLSSFSVSSSAMITGLVIQSNVADSIGNIWIDDIAFVPAGASAPTQAATKAPTAAPTQAATKAPTAAPTQAATKAPTAAPTQAATKAPTAAPTQAATKAPTAAPTQAATKAPTAAPTQAATKAPTSAPATKAPVNAPSADDGCDTSSVRLVQSSGGSWDTPNGKQVSQWNVEVSHSCSGKKLVGLTVSASNWNPVNFWNWEGSASSLSLPAYASIGASSPFVVGYQNTGGQATFTVTSVTFQ